MSIASAAPMHSSRSLPPLLLLAALGLALFLSSMWTARADASGVSTAVVYATRFVSFGTYMLVAWFFRNHLPQVALVLRLGVSFMAVHLVLALVSPLLPLNDAASLALNYGSAVFEGIANALLTLLFAHIFSTFAPRLSAVGIAVAYLGVDVGILALDLLDIDVLHYTRPAFTCASLILLVVCTHRLLLPGAPGTSRPLQYGMAEASAAPDIHPIRFFSTHTNWLLLLIVAILFPNLFGVIAQVSSETGGNFALYDVTTEIMIIALQVVFLLFMVFFGSSYGFAAILAFTVPLYATGFALFPADWEAGIPVAGCFIRGGYVVLTVLIWALMARTSYADPRHTYLYFGVYCGVSNAQLGRVVGSLLMGEAGPNLPLCLSLSLGSLWAICIFGLAMFFLLRRDSRLSFAEKFSPMGEAATQETPRVATVNATDSTSDIGQATATDPFVRQFQALSERVHLTPREREVLAEAIHGYSRTNIAKKLCLSPETVKTYLNRAYTKAGVSSKQELIALIESESAP